ncbi:hypothetical protein [Streptomyces cyaneofuscatus]|uniref:hypothetical protein n=1 Tax=Streptomyces cyaneofuscatus TaxID=66883 RepID=UPI0036D7E118
MSRRPSNTYRPKVSRPGSAGLRFGMFAVCVTRDSDAGLNSGKAKPLYDLLVSYADVSSRDTRQGYPYREALASCLDCSKQTIDRAAEYLETEIGLITVHRRKVDGKPDENDANLYEVHDAWLIHGMLPPVGTPPQLVARYGSTVPGLDVDAWIGEHAPDFDLPAWREAYEAKVREQGAKREEQRRKERERRRKSKKKSQGHVTGDVTPQDGAPQGDASEGGGVTHDASGDVMDDASGDVMGDALSTAVAPDPSSPERPAPPARSAPDVRRTTAGSSARDELNGGCAATEEPGLVADEAAEPVDGPAIDEQESAGAEGGVPVQRSSGGRQAAGKGTGRKPSPFSPELRGAIYATEALLPAQLREALAVLLPHGHLPNTTRKVTAQALETRTPEELGERAARRWVSYGYERDHYDGLLRKPIGIVEELLRPTPYCPAADCEDGADRHTGEQCIPCAERIENRKRARRAGKAVPTSRPPRIYRDREACVDCDRPLVGDTPDDGLCRDCRASLDRAAAYINGPLPGADAEPEPVDEEPNPYGPCPPNAEFVHWRDRQRAEKRAAQLAALGISPPPF